MKRNKKSVQQNEIERKSNIKVANEPQQSAFFTPLQFAVCITFLFFITALIGLMYHEMWRDEHQAWLVARDAHSLPQLFQNLRYEGNPALWHLLLFFITCVTHDPVFMQALHLLIACGFIFVFNYYAPVGNIYKFLFSFGYFAVYEYAVISRSYGLGVLLVFIVCALFKNRNSNYLLLGIVLGLLANVTVFGMVIALGIAGILLLDYWYYQEKIKVSLRKLLTGGIIFLILVLLSLYQIIPDENNAFPAFYATEIFDFVRWGSVASRIPVSYICIPETEGIHFWNTTMFFTEGPSITPPFYKWFANHPAYLWGWFYMPAILYLLSIIIFIRRPLICLLYASLSFGLISVFYYTGLIHLRYSGYLFIVLIICYWLSSFYGETHFRNASLRFLSGVGKKIQYPFLLVVLLANITGAIIAYSKDLNHAFSNAAAAADFIKENKMDTLTIVGASDYITGPLASYLDTKLFYPQMNDYGSFCIWSKQRQDDISFKQIVNAVHNLLSEGRNSLLLIYTIPPQISNNGKSEIMQRGLILQNTKMELLKSFEGAIIADENYYIYLIRKVDASKEDLSGYPVIQ